MTPQFISLKFIHNIGYILLLMLANSLKTQRHWGLIFKMLLMGLPLYSTSLWAETVQRWQDSSGQWHFGDQAAAKGHASKPVLVTTPISIIKNEQPVIAGGIKASPKSRRVSARKSTKKYSARSTSPAPTGHCDQLRQQLHQQPDHLSAKRNKASDAQTLASRYEHECIAGQYFSN
ncbi:MAG: hypothetical protein EOO69_03040 [Moraxellaceae bacterium]|nr:MAG: hypothetical protein EOO69_03040 [Moraxellaceae bacterium]